MGNGVCWADRLLSHGGCTALWLVSVTWVSSACPHTYWSTVQVVDTFTCQLPGSLSVFLYSQPLYCPSSLCLSACLSLSVVVSGETLEESLRREVAEEVGLEVLSFSYSASQHWPFPHSSFMLGCHASVSPAHTQVGTDTM